MVGLFSELRNGATDEDPRGSDSGCVRFSVCVYKRLVLLTPTGEIVEC